LYYYHSYYYEINLDKFSSLRGFSGYSFIRSEEDLKAAYNGIFNDAASFNKKVHVLFLGIGSEENSNTKNFSDMLTKAGIKNTYYLSSGTAHEWQSWRRSLHEFAQLLFK